MVRPQKKSYDGNIAGGLKSALTLRAAPAFDVASFLKGFIPPFQSWLAAFFARLM